MLLVHDDDPSPSLLALDSLSAVSWDAFEHLSANAPVLVRDLLSVDMGMSPSDLATMIRAMSPEQRVSLARMAKRWFTPHAIGESEFANCTALALPTLSSSLTAIGDAAFFGCTSLSVEEWDAPLLTTVGVSAFGCCEDLTLEMWFAPNLTAIVSGVFEVCESLVLSTWYSPALTTINGEAFKDCGSLTLEHWHAPLLTFIGEEAFCDCAALVWENGCPFSLDIDIEDGAFHGCTNLSELARSQIMEINPNALDPV